MPISVDLPAPFSPTRPWMVEGARVSETSRLAWTSPNHLSTPRSSIIPTPTPPRERGGDIAQSLRRVVRDFDLAGDDVGARLGQAAFHVRSDQVAVVLVDRIADAALGDADGAAAGLPRAVLRALERVVDREVDTLDHRGQHGAGLEVVLVRVDADGELALVLGGLQHAEAGGAGSRVDDVGAAIELAAGQLAPARRIVPGGRRGAGHVLEDLDPGIDVPRALLVAERELADQRNVHAADEPDLAALAGHGRGHADQERSLVLLEHDRLHVGQVDHAVDDRELGGREFLGDLLDGRGLGEADAHHDLRAAPGHVALGLLALGLVGDLELAVRDARLLLEALGPRVGRLVERLV